MGPKARFSGVRLGEGVPDLRKRLLDIQAFPPQRISLGEMFALSRFSNTLSPPIGLRHLAARGAAERDEQPKGGANVTWEGRVARRVTPTLVRA